MMLGWWPKASLGSHATCTPTAELCWAMEKAIVASMPRTAARPRSKHVNHCVQPTALFLHHDSVAEGQQPQELPQHRVTVPPGGFQQRHVAKVQFLLPMVAPGQPRPLQEARAGCRCPRERPSRVLCTRDAAGSTIQQPCAGMIRVHKPSSALPRPRG